MSGRNTTVRPSGGDEDNVWTPGDTMQMDAVLADCASVVHVDGRVTPDERTRLVERMRNSPTVAFFGTDDLLTLFEALTPGFENDRDEGEAHAAVTVSCPRHQPAFSGMVIETVRRVPLADDGFDAEERDVILRHCSIFRADRVSFARTVDRGQGR